MTPEEFRAALEEFGLDQRTFARRMGMTHGNINRWATGVQKVPPYVDYVFRLMREVEGITHDSRSVVAQSILPHIQRMQEALGIAPPEAVPPAADIGNGNNWIVERHRLLKNYSAVAEEFGISRQRVQQIVAKYNSSKAGPRPTSRSSAPLPPPRPTERRVGRPRKPYP